MADDLSGPSVPDAPPGLDLAFSWLQRNLDQLTEASRRTAAIAATMPPPVPIADPAHASMASTAAPTAVPAPTAGVAGGPAAGAHAAEPGASAAVAAPLPAATATAPPAIGGTASRPTPLLDGIGRDLTKLAAEGSLAPVIGREDETAWMIEILVRRTKRNPVLLGPAGVGKTAIVEGLAQRIVARRVPAPLLGVRVVEVPLAAITAGTQYRGQLEERVAQLVSEASQPGIVLFLDEIHLLAGAGRTEGGMGAAEALKPALSRGDIAMIGATTPEDYRATIAKDPSLARRFTTVVVPELDRAATRPILLGVRDALARSRGVTASDEALDVLLAFADRSIANRRFPDKAIDLLEQAIAAAIVAGHTTVDAADAAVTTEAWSARASSTPTVERFGRDLVGLARDGRLGPIVGRDRELDAITEVLLRRTKRNPLLVGPAGSGKTAIVEGLALRIAAGAVPDALRDVRIFDVPLLSLAASVTADPALLGDFLVEVRHPSVVVFFDEIHLLAAPAVRDLAESLKPALARGEIACIGATTAEEYQADIEPETALARRFTEIPVEPMDQAAVHAVLVAVRDRLAALRGIPVTDAALAELVALAGQFLPNRAFPDKGVDLIEQSVAYAMTHGRTEVDVPTAREAVAALIGMPLDPTARLVALSTALRDRALLEPDAAAALVGRLGVSLRGLDAHGERPDAVVLLCGAAAGSASTLASTLAATVFGRETAVIDIDLSGMADDSSISTLLGSAPGLIGSERQLPLHGLRRTPWAVVVLRGVDACAFAIRDVVGAALDAGSFTDAMGRRIPLGAALVVLTAPGLDAGGDAPAAALLAARLGPVLVGACDVISGSTSSAAADARAAWIGRELLDPLAVRLGRAGYPVTFDASFVAWLDRRLPTDGSSPQSFLDREVTPRIVAGLPADPGPLSVRANDDGPVIGTASAARPGPGADPLATSGPAPATGGARAGAPGSPKKPRTPRRTGASRTT
jgi:ATP-dependent Clp protease ATP-binding subunit ClpC